ncbi:MAG: RidA family protein [Planctomycetota bacterium]|jgi:enamine deaminase RidA (YjgF/YER057c/UK114 family)
MKEVTRVGDSVTLRRLEGTGFDLAFLTGLGDPDLAPADGALALFKDIADVLVENRIETVQEKVYGRTDSREELLAIREGAYRSAGLDSREVHATFHQGTSIDTQPFRGAQIWGVVPKDPEVTVTTVAEGRYWRGKDFRILHLPGVRGLGKGGELAESAPAQARCMFKNAAAALENHDFAFNQVSRTWIYLKRLLEWYDDFNGVRNGFFAEQGVGRNSERSFPASTGIQGTSEGEECSMDVLATEGSGVISSPLRKSSRQGSAADYGSSFSRAMSVQVGGLDMIFVSGTASIDPSGASIHIGDAEAQILETLKCISDLLGIRGATLKDIHLATLFGKTQEVLDMYPRVARDGGMEGFPAVPVVADVCRDDLLVEIEALATVPS